MGPYNEQDFEDHIEDYLLETDYHKKLSKDYDKELCLISEELLSFIKDSQLDEYNKLTEQYGSSTDQKLCQRISSEISKRGTLDVLRKGVKDRGSEFALSYFKPSSGMNPEHMEQYKKNRFTVVRQLKYSNKNEKSLDMAIFLNGLPIITMELKNSLTGQFVNDAIKQYKNDRDPKEPLFKFMRCLVHFAVGNEKIYMTTQLKGKSTFFLPFNMGIENLLNPDGHKTAYLWEDILQKDSLLDLINNYLHLQINKERVFNPATRQLEDKTSRVFIFPRFHQLDAVRHLLKRVKFEGVGQSYLIQHSAGSGKSNSIAWLAHQLASLYQKTTDTERMFDSIVVVTDRKILDKQLQDTIKQFEQTAGVVNPIDMNSAQLKEALQVGKSIIISTIQKFGVIADEMGSLKGNNFAIIIDEAHSSQSGESRRNLNKVLTAKTLKDAESEEVDEFDVDDEVTKQLKEKGKQPNISYFALTATPKNKTLELFGDRLQSGGFVGDHIYSMKQAIEENFILDVLKNYTTFKRYFKLTKEVEEDKKYRKKKVMKMLTQHVDLQAHAIETKANIVMEHFKTHVVNQIAGRSRAMFVTRSRLHAVKYFIEFKKLMKEEGLPFLPIVAFSGTVYDGSAEHTETSLNGFPSKQITDALKKPEYRMLVVANKFQTGFDEPLLHTMYVDKILGGVSAVQTLSRLNRTMKGKTDTIVLDFVNDAEDILNSFQPYYQTALIDKESEPNKLYDMLNRIAEYEIYSKEDVEDFAAAFFDPKISNLKLQPILDNVVSVWNSKEDEEREDFRSQIQGYVRLYSFLSQLITFVDVDLEKQYVFLKNLNKKLPKRNESVPYEVLDAVDLESFRIQRTYEGEIQLETEDGVLRTPSDDVGKQQEQEKELLSIIVDELNKVYSIDLSEDDKIDIKRVEDKVSDNEELKAVMVANNTAEAKKVKFEETLEKELLNLVHSRLDLYKKLKKPEINKLIKKLWYEKFKKDIA